MKYTATIAILDGQPDCTGDVLSANVEIPTETVVVTNAFSRPPIGKAVIKRDGDRIVAEIDIPGYDGMEPDFYECLKAVIGGSIVKRNGPLIEKWILSSVGLTDMPCDYRLPNLKRKIEE